LEEIPKVVAEEGLVKGKREKNSRRLQKRKKKKPNHQEEREQNSERGGGCHSQNLNTTKSTKPGGKKKILNQLIPVWKLKGEKLTEDVDGRKRGGKGDSVRWLIKRTAEGAKGQDVVVWDL